MPKCALLIVSFGTSHLDTLYKNIARIETDVASRFPDFALRRAFTSNIIMQKLKSRDGISVDNVSAALNKLRSDAFSHVVVQPTHIINGDEFNKILSQIAPFINDFDSIRVGDPLLTSFNDHQRVINALFSDIPPLDPDHAVVFMGHGSEHFANSAYALFDYVLNDLGFQAFTGTVEGYPSINQVIARLNNYPMLRRVSLLPLMVVAGDHAVNDMAGDDPDSWKNVLADLGFSVDCYLKGLGEFAGVRQIFADHAVNAKEV